MGDLNLFGRSPISSSGQLQSPVTGNTDGDSPLTTAWNLATSGFHGVLSVGHDAPGNFGTGMAPAAPTPDTPDSAQPTLAGATATAASAQLASERQAANASSILTGGAGLLDQPTTSSRVLLGS